MTVTYGDEATRPWPEQCLHAIFEVADSGRLSSDDQATLVVAAAALKPFVRGLPDEAAA